MLKLLKYLNWKEWILVALTLLILCVQAFCNITLPRLMGDITDQLELLGGQDSGAIWNKILILTAEGFATIVAIIVITILVEYLSAIVTTNLTARVRSKLYKQVNNFSMEEINKFSVPSLITRTTNDLMQVQGVYNTILGFGFTAPLTAIFAIIEVVNLSPKLSIVNVVSVTALVFLAFIIFALVIPKFKTIQKVTDKVNHLTRENLTGLRVVRAYSAEKQQENKFENTNRFATKLDLFVGRVFALLDPGITLIMQGTQIAIVWVVSIISSSNFGIVSIVQKFSSYSNQIIMGFMTISMLFMLIPRGIVSAKRINEVLETTSSIKDGKIDKTDTQKQPKKNGSIVFDKVFFKYPGASEYVLEDISFSVKPGQTVAFIGSTGSGKSTLINLIPRFYDCTSGDITIDGINVKDYKLSFLHDKLGYVPQRGVLFSGSVLENLKYGNSQATQAEIKEAIDVSESQFVYGLENGLDHFISQGGKNVSGGQKQRLSIARAIVKKPEIFIFDDSFSALDYKTDKSLRHKLKKYTGGATCLIVAQRIGTIMNADQIVVLNEGKIVGIGKHKELLQNCKIYKEIALSQLTEEELAK